MEQSCLRVGLRRQRPNMLTKTITFECRLAAPLSVGGPCFILHITRPDQMETDILFHTPGNGFIRLAEGLERDVDWRRALLSLSCNLWLNAR